ncbi:TonB-dependent receptor [Gaetbulibacter sp. M240]|uniref:TonB-dependent receptor domain-containing protein n=1 Tax=Gaetbulibacter sp. M240 TaxID=3126511 RepID=UPI00374E854B
MRKLFIIAPVLLFYTFTLPSVFGQTTDTGSVSGKFISETGDPVVYASIVLFQNDSTFVKSTISTTEGSFKFKNVYPGKYTVIIKQLEFEDYKTSLFAIAPGEDKVLPDIRLKPASNTLDEVVITQKKSLITVKPDKLVFNVANSPSASGTNGLDLLRQSPGVTLDIDNSISLLGKKNVQIYINDVQSRLSGDDLISFLQSMSSDNVDSIEIISNPPAKYDAEGTGGIINIRLKRNIATGFNGSISSNGTKGVEYRYNNNLSLNFGSEKIKTNLDLSQSSLNYLERFDDDKYQNNYFLQLSSREPKITNALNVGFGIQAELSKNQRLTFDGRAVYNKTDNQLNSITNIYQDVPREFQEILKSQSFRTGNSSNYIFNLNHFWNIGESSSLTTNFSAGTYESDRNTFQPNTYFEPDGTTVISQEDTSFDSDNTINLWSGKMDFEKSWDKTTFTIGVKYAHILTQNGFYFYNYQNNNPVLDPARSNDFEYTENVAAAYANLNFKISNSFTLNTGLRVENTYSRGLLTSEVAVENKDVKRNYTNFFPNIGISFDNQKDHNFSFNIGRRITRPNYQSLNPFETPTSQLVVWKGNPFLRPNYIMNYQLSYSLKQKLITTFAFSKTKDFFSNIVEVLNENKTQIIPRNVQKSNNYAMSLTYPLTLADFWEVLIFGNLYYETFEGNVNNNVIDIENTGWNYRLQNMITIPKDILLELTFNHNSRWIWRGSSYIKGNYGLNFGIRKDFLNKNLQLRITGNDIFRTKSEYPYYLNYGGIDLEGVYTMDNQRFGLGITYKFGNQNAKNKIKSEGGLDEELNRISE